LQLGGPPRERVCHSSEPAAGAQSNCVGHQLPFAVNVQGRSDESRAGPQFDLDAGGSVLLGYA
jgi:hypothetical protein